MSAATATPLDEPIYHRVEDARARLRDAGIDPAAVPHAGAETWEDFEQEVGELAALGLDGDKLITVLAGPVVPDPPELALVARVIAEMRDEQAPLVRPDDVSIRHGSAIMGRPVPGAALVVCYVPADTGFVMVNIVRRAG